MSEMAEELDIVIDATRAWKQRQQAAEPSAVMKPLVIFTVPYETAKRLELGAPKSDFTVVGISYEGSGALNAEAIAQALPPKEYELRCIYAVTDGYYKDGVFAGSDSDLAIDYANNPESTVARSLILSGMDRNASTVFCGVLPYALGERGAFKTQEGTSFHGAYERLDERSPSKSVTLMVHELKKVVSGR